MISAEAVKKLRDESGAGILDCKKALEKAQGDIKKAMRILKGMGVAIAGGKKSRATAVGRIFISSNDPPHHTSTAMIEVRCESDFVARSQAFLDVGKAIVELLAAKGDSAAVLRDVQQIVDNAIATIKENIQLQRHTIWTHNENELVTSYIHGDSGRLGALVQGSYNNSSKEYLEKIKEMLFDITLHVAAYQPHYLSAHKIDPLYLQEQEEIFYQQAQKLNKPDNVTAGIVKGKLNKHLKGICLLTQPFLKDESKTVAQYIEQCAPSGSGLVVDRYCFYSSGQDALSERTQ